MSRKIEKKEFESQFDVVDWNLLRFHQTLQINDVVRLADAYDKTISCETKKSILQKFFQKSIESAINESPYVIFPNELFSINVKETLREKETKVISKRGLDNRVRLIEQRDKKAEWEKEIRQDGRAWKFVGTMNNRYDYYELDFSAELNALATKAGLNRKKYLQNTFDWQMAK